MSRLLVPPVPYRRRCLPLQHRQFIYFVLFYYVKKIVAISSSESDSDSDLENTLVCRTPKNKRKVTVAATPKSTRKSSNSDDEHGSTPPKQKKSDDEKAVTPPTPSTLLRKLNLDTSSEKEEKLIPKKLFTANKYCSARQALHSSVPDNLPGREEELGQLQDFIEEHLKEEKSGSLYVSGPPGTGKTACLSKLMMKPEFKSKFKVVYVNCTTMKTAATIYGTIIDELGLTAPNSNKYGKKIIEKYLATNHKMILLVLDELDQLDSKKQTVLYSIFEWPSKPNSKLILVGIANALDLTDRMLPRLQARCELKPKLMHFAPYSKQQIFNIISTRLTEANVSDVFTGHAVQMLAGKVAAISGDIRRALDISRRVVELAESQKAPQVLRPTTDNSSNTTSPKKQPPPEDKPVDLKDVVNVLNGIFGGSQNINKEENTFPLQQKLVLCSLLLILNKGRHKDVTVGRLFEVYKKVCKKRNIYAVDTSEFVSLCSLIETRGILRLSGKKEPRFMKVNLEWDQEEVDAALQDKVMMDVVGTSHRMCLE